MVHHLFIAPIASITRARRPGIRVTRASSVQFPLPSPCLYSSPFPLDLSSSLVCFPPPRPTRAPPAGRTIRALAAITVARRTRFALVTVGDETGNPATSAAAVGVSLRRPVSAVPFAATGIWSCVCARGRVSFLPFYFCLSLVLLLKRPKATKHKRAAKQLLVKRNKFFCQGSICPLFTSYSGKSNPLRQCPAYLLQQGRHFFPCPP